MKLPASLVLASMIWYMVAVGVIPRFVRSLAWVAIIVLAGGNIVVWMLSRFDDDPFALPFRLTAVAISTILAMFMSELSFRRKHGWWRILDGETGRKRQSEDGAKHPNQ